MPSGWDDLDKLTSGWQPGDLIILAGRPSMGKSSCAVNMAENAAIRHGTPVAIFSLEMSKEQLAMRLLCSQSEVSLQRSARAISATRTGRGSRRARAC